MMWGHDWMWDWGFFPMFLGGMLPFVVVGVGVFLLVQALGGRREPAAPPAGFTSLPPSPVRGETALEIAERRYAAGELTRDEFLRIREDLRPGGPPPATPS